MIAGEERVAILTVADISVIYRNPERVSRGHRGFGLPDSVFADFCCSCAVKRKSKIHLGSSHGCCVIKTGYESRGGGRNGPFKVSLARCMRHGRQSQQG